MSRSRGLEVFRAAEAPSLQESGIGEGVTTPSPEIREILREAALGEGSIGTVPFRTDGLSLVSIYFKPGYRSTRHSHNADCVYYVVSGSVTLGQQTLGAGDGFFVPANAPYQFQAGPDGFHLLEFRNAGSYDQQLWDDDPARWKAVVDAAIENRERWSEIVEPPRVAFCATD